MAKDVVDQLLGKGRVVRGQLGVLVSELSPEMAATFDYEGKQGILVQDVTRGSAAERSGIDSGDIVETLDGSPVTSVSQFRAAVAKKTPGSTVKLGLWRKSGRRVIEVELGDAAVPPDLLLRRREGKGAKPVEGALAQLLQPPRPGESRCRVRGEGAHRSDLRIVFSACAGRRA